ncbi:MAG: dTDP-glucose 4,6-dehydratase [bacterium]|nr:dTDP-glucose 4,6-dehydratase [bacterium]
MKVLITGGAGFIGSNFVRYWLKKHPDDFVLNLDALTYAGHIESLKDISPQTNYSFVQGDIVDEPLVDEVMKDVDLVVHFAAESHVDRSILEPMKFVKTNVLGTGVLLEAARRHKVSRYHHVSTDEVFGQLTLDEPSFNEHSMIKPRMPYSASKAASDLLTFSYGSAYGLPVTVSNCSNNYGPYQDTEKLVPRFITNLIDGKKLPLMGSGENIRDWLHVQDHCSAIDFIIQNGTSGERYCIGGDEEHSNFEITKIILKHFDLDDSWIEPVEHRLGHDLRYSVDASKLMKMGWKLSYTFEQGITETINWYKNNQWWWEPLKKDRPNIDPKQQRISAGFQ